MDKNHIYSRGRDLIADQDFGSSAAYGKIRLGQTHIFWKKGLRWYTVSLDQVSRAYRQVEFVYGKLCCGGSSFDIQRLALVLQNGETLILTVGDNQIGDQIKKEAEVLYQVLQETHPGWQFGKE